MEGLEGVRIVSALHYNCTAPIFGHEHAHESIFHVTLIRAGRERILLGESEYDGQPGDVFFVRPGDPHASRVEARRRAQEFELMEVKFDVPAPASREHLPQIPPRTRLAGPSELPVAMERLVAAHLVDLSGTSWLSRVRLAETLLLLAGELRGRGGTPNASDRPLDRRIRQAVEYIAVNYARPICLEELAEVAGLSVSHFSANFRQRMQTSPMQFVIDRRMFHARQLLRDSAMSVAEISRVCGFCSPQQFSQLFRQRYETTPGRYRRER
jgi:AraC-like DNA-binding protein